MKLLLMVSNLTWFLALFLISYFQKILNHLIINYIYKIYFKYNLVIVILSILFFMLFYLSTSIILVFNSVLISYKIFRINIIDSFSKPNDKNEIVIFNPFNLSKYIKEKIEKIWLDDNTIEFILIKVRLSPHSLI